MEDYSVFTLSFSVGDEAAVNLLRTLYHI